ncbi:PilZ domain-containing protein [bacterium]|nr:PilZ domain-containing protein [bacterium]
MEELIKSAKDFRIIPNVIECSAICTVSGIKGEKLSLELDLDEGKIKDNYINGETVEVFGSTEEGLIYFKGKIIGAKGNTVELAIPTDFTKVQRREYSRIEFDGEVEIKEDGIKTRPVDISAGGIKFISTENLIIGKSYNTTIKLKNNLDINCETVPIRTYQTEATRGNFIICSKFKNLKSIDRVAIVQYTFKQLMELENKLNG